MDSIDENKDKARDSVNLLADDAFNREFDKIFPLPAYIPAALKVQSE